MRGEVIIATYNRERELYQCLKCIEKNTFHPNRIIIIDASASSSFAYDGQLNILYYHTAQAGLTVQRNVGIDLLDSQTEVVTFLDDDFYVMPNYFENLYTKFENDSDLVGADGTLLRDGNRNIKPLNCDTDVETLYGCNMSFRVTSIGQTRFDEKLKMYAFMEDWDFSYQISRKGEMKRLHLCLGIHDRCTNKPIDDKKMGYMIIANNCYLKRKNNVYSYHENLYYIAYIIKHMVCFWSHRSRLRFLGALKGYWKVVINKEEP